MIWMAFLKLYEHNTNTRYLIECGYCSLGTELAFLQSRPVCGTLWSPKNDNGKPELITWKAYFKKEKGQQFVSSVPKQSVVKKKKLCITVVNGPLTVNDCIHT